MSDVTNLLLSFSILEDSGSKVRHVNEWLAQNDQAPLASLWENDACYGGSKRMDVPVYAGAFSEFPLEVFLVFLRSVEWHEPNAVQVMLRAPGDVRWRLIDA